MKKSIKKFLEFNGKVIYFLSHEGQYWVALRPICEALKVSYAWNLKKLKKHAIYSKLWSKPTMVDSNFAKRSMVALPEKYIYMWIAQLPISSNEHAEYVMQCVDVLYDYFHGGITGRKEALSRKAEIQIERKELMNELKNNKLFIKLKELDAEEARKGKLLKQLDNDIITQQLTLFN